MCRWSSRSENGHHKLTVGDQGQLEVDDIVPFGSESGEPAKLTDIFHPAATTLTIAKATGASGLSAFGIDFANAGKSGFSATVRLVGASAMAMSVSSGGRRVAAADARVASPADVLLAWRLAIIGALIVLAAIAWWVTDLRMAGMDAGPGHRPRVCWASTSPPGW